MKRRFRAVATQPQRSVQPSEVGTNQEASEGDRHHNPLRSHPKYVENGSEGKRDAQARPVTAVRGIHAREEAVEPFAGHAVLVSCGQLIFVLFVRKWRLKK